MTKTLVADRVEDYDWQHEKLEGLAVTENGYRRKSLRCFSYMAFAYQSTLF
ncbi:MAG: hypothetical protein F6J87_28450 [Spirulina sp. SIO3F2]|nr:hypothetical protein [Spirulina sp. SIO3F2]